MSTSVFLWVEPKEFWLLNNANELGAEGVVDLKGRYGSIAVQVTGTFSATVTFKASIDGTNWTDIQGTNIANGTGAVSTTSPGIFVFKVLGITKFKVVVSSYTDGVITAKAIAVPLT